MQNGSLSARCRGFQFTIAVQTVLSCAQMRQRNQPRYFTVEAEVLFLYRDLMAVPGSLATTSEQVGTAQEAHYAAACEHSDTVDQHAPVVLATSNCAYWCSGTTGACRSVTAQSRNGCCSREQAGRPETSLVCGRTALNTRRGRQQEEATKMQGEVEKTHCVDGGGVLVLSWLVSMSAQRRTHKPSGTTTTHTQSLPMHDDEACEYL